jgi:hypothetical protein
VTVTRLRQSVANGATPRIFDITSMRILDASGWWQRKWTAWPLRKYLSSKGGTAMTFA